MGELLTPQQHLQIEAHALQAEDPRVQRRARLLLLYNEGSPTREVAAHVGLSRGRARYWRRRFRAQGMALFPESAPERVASEAGLGIEAEEPPPATQELSTGDHPPQAKRLAPIEPAELSSLLALRSPGVEPDDPLSEAGRKVMRYHFAEMLRHENGTRSGMDIEQLHDMRVATRRMRAAFEVFADAFKPKALRSHFQGVRATGRALGRVRDLDVFMEKAQKYLETLPEDHRPGLQPLLSSWLEEREKDRAEMLAHLDSPDYQDFKRKFHRFLTTPGAGAQRLDAVQPQPSLVRHVAPALVYTRLAAVRAYAPILSTASVEQMHGLRIEFKKLRYTLEFFREALGAEAKEVINEIKGLQDHLGDLNDADVACQILREFLDQMDKRQQALPIGERFNPEPVVAYLGYRHAERHHLMQSFQPAWERFERPELRRLLARTVEGL